MARKRLPATPATPPIHSVRLADFGERAPGVYPGSTLRAKYLVRMHKKELVACGALVRIGRDLVILLDPYSKWLSRHASRVEGFEATVNRHRATQSAI